MLVLAIETSNPSAASGIGAVLPGVALGEPIGSGRGVHVIGMEPVAVDRSHDNDLLPAIGRLCARSGIGADQIGRVGVSVGPGGFTAVRVAVAAGQMIAEAVRARAVAVPSAHVAAARAPRGEPFAVALACKGDEAWVTVFDGDANEVAPGRLMGSAEVAGLGVALVIGDRFLPAGMVVDMERRGVGRVVPPVFDPCACLELAVLGAAVDPSDLRPIYPREAEAVRKWRELHGGR